MAESHPHSFMTWRMPVTHCLQTESRGSARCWLSVYRNTATAMSPVFRLSSRSEMLVSVQPHERSSSIRFPQEDISNGLKPVYPAPSDYRSSLLPTQSVWYSKQVGKYIFIVLFHTKVYSESQRQQPTRPGPDTASTSTRHCCLRHRFYQL